MLFIKYEILSDILFLNFRKYFFILVKLISDVFFWNLDTFSTIPFVINQFTFNPIMYVDIFRKMNITYAFHFKFFIKNLLNFLFEEHFISFLFPYNILLILIFILILKELKYVSLLEKMPGTTEVI